MDRSDKSNGMFRGLIAVAAIAVVALAVTSFAGLQAQDNGKDAKVAQVGTYDMQMAFQQYPGREELMKTYQSVRSEMSKAQKEGDQKKAKEIQQKLQKKQQEIIEKFRSDVEKAVPKVAKSTGVKVVAMQVVYTAEGINTKDITPQIVEKIGGDPEAVKQARQAPSQLPSKK